MSTRRWNNPAGYFKKQLSIGHFMDTHAAAAILDIDLDAIRHNIDLIRQRVGDGCAVAGVVKANAYGIGLEQVANIHLACGTRTFFVATPEEGIVLRRICDAQGARPEIGILGGLFHGAEGEYVRHGLVPVLNSLMDIERWRHPDPVMIHIDTGMRRLGLDTAETARLQNDPALLRDLNVAVVLSHFACADEPGHKLTRVQYEQFRVLAGLFPQARKSLSNSAGIFVSRDFDFDLVRPGMAVYGLNPMPGHPNPMRPVVRLRARVLQVRTAQQGESVGYGASYVCQSERRVATIALGYADGFLRSLSGRGNVFWQGRALPILGRVSMDLVTIDASAAPGLEAGDWVEVIGPDQDADSLAALAGTIGYEILTGLGSRYHRRYRTAAAGDTKLFDSKDFSG